MLTAAHVLPLLRKKIHAGVASPTLRRNNKTGCQRKNTLESEEPLNQSRRGLFGLKFPRRNVRILNKLFAAGEKLIPSFLFSGIEILIGFLQKDILGDIDISI